MRFNKGDIVQRSYGKRVATVLDEANSATSYRMRVKWEHSGKSELVPMKDFCLADQENIEKVTKMDALYTVSRNGKTLVLTKKMEVTKDQWLMLVSGTGEAILCPPSELTEIVPYTIKVNINGTEKTFVAEKDQYQKDEVYLMGKTLEIARIVAVDTKARLATNEFKPFAKLNVQLDF